MRIGVDYYPEHWEKERWKTDAEMMAKANIKVVRIGEFAWSLYEPKENDFQFGWMDEILDFFHDHGISVVLCTPSATPPKWMTDKYPDIFQDDIHGNPKIFGTRKHYCFNSQTYRSFTRSLVEKIAKRYGSHPAVEAWQIDNELGWANTTRCYCKKCEKEFRQWLKDKYKTIETLNRVYGTVFWSQIYNSFEEVIIPRAGACYDTCHDTQGQNPALLLDYYRFSSDSVIRFAKESAEVIKKYSSKPVTSNLLDAAVNSGTGIDYFKLAEQLDFVSWDNYIEFQWGIAEASTVSRDHSLLRSYKKQPFWVMEQQSGPCGWSKMGPAPTPGKLRLWTYQAVANGADTVVYFRWRACPFGTEENWHGILNHDGKPNRRYEEIVQVGSEMEQLSKTLGPLKPTAKVAVIKSFDSEWSHSIHKHVENFQYDQFLLSFYKPFYDMGIPVDFAAPYDDLSQYSFVIAPALLMVTDQEKENLENYVRTGGTLLLTFRSGIKDVFNNMLKQTVPGTFASLAGVEVMEYDPQFQKETASSGVFGASVSKLWCDVVEPVSAEPLGFYTQDYYSGKACLTVNQFGNGAVYYLGCDLDSSAMNRLMKYLCHQLKLECNPCPIEGVEQVEATDGKEQVLFLMNHNSYPVVVPLDRVYENLLAQRKEERTVTISPYDVAILK
ncbi:MAG TPA: beta-galactosidase [Caproicibacter sp.]|nr:beta-galactosidase [Caproicibacter sp.]